MIDQPRHLSIDESLGRRIEALKHRRWPREAARAWFDKPGWLCGFNFLPSTAVNFIDMWQRGSFDVETIERELGWARDVGFNTIRTNLPFVVWQDDRDGLLDRIDSFLCIADRFGMTTMPCLLDDCGFSGDGPAAGPQPAPIPGVHNSRAVASPGRGVVTSSSRWLEVEAYVCDVVRHFAHDTRIIAWDLYNEPGNMMIFARDGEHAFDSTLGPFALRLMVEVFSICRDIAPAQPLTVAGWHVPSFGTMPAEFYDNAIDQTAFALSDAISFHAYTAGRRVAAIIEQLRAFQRPILCTEWMARQAESRIEDQLALFHAEGVGAWQWGLVNGRTQTHVPWPAIAEANPEAVGEWFHDLLHEDGTAYRSSEVIEIRRLVGKR